MSERVIFTTKQDKRGGGGNVISLIWTFLHLKIGGSHTVQVLIVTICICLYGPVKQQKGLRKGKLTILSCRGYGHAPGEP